MKFPQRFHLKRVSLRVLLLVALGFVVEVLPWKMGPSPSPMEAFQEVVGQPAPKGISNLIVVNRQYLTKSWCWMRFRASDDTIASLLRKGQRVEDPLVKQVALQGMRGVVNHKYDSNDQQAVDWQTVLKIQKPEIYQLSSYSENVFWVSYLIVDRKNHLVYVHGSGD